MLSPQGNCSGNSNGSNTASHFIPTLPRKKAPAPQDTTAFQLTLLGTWSYQPKLRPCVTVHEPSPVGLASDVSPALVPVRTPNPQTGLGKLQGLDAMAETSGSGGMHPMDLSRAWRDCRSLMAHGHLGRKYSPCKTTKWPHIPSLYSRRSAKGVETRLLIYWYSRKHGLILKQIISIIWNVLYRQEIHTTSYARFNSFLVISSLT